MRGKVRQCSEVFIPGFKPVTWWEGVVYPESAVMDATGWPTAGPGVRPVYATGVDWRRVYNETLRMLGLTPRGGADVSE
jgi:hypothetical protein